MRICPDESEMTKQKSSFKKQTNTERKTEMKKFHTDIIFVSPDMQQARFSVCAKNVSTLLRAEHLATTQIFGMTINLEKLPKTGERICLLSRAAILTILEEGEEDSSFETEEQVEDEFTFDVVVHRGYIDGKQQMWVELRRDMIRFGDMNIPTEDRVNKNRFIVTQLVRFGVLDKIKLDAKTA